MSKKTIGSLLIRLGLEPKEADMAIKKFEKSLRDMGRRMESIGRNMSIGFTAPFLLGIRQSIKAYDEEAQVVRKLQIALGGNTSALIAQASALQNVTTFADDQIITQQAWAAALGHSEGEILKMTTAATGLAAGLGIELGEAMKGLHKTTTGTAGVLGKLIPEIKNMTAEQLKSGAAIDLVNEKFKGFAEAAAMTGAGPIKILQNSFGDLMESIGKAALPIVISITKKIQDLVTWLNNLDPSVQRAVVAFGAVVAAIGPLLVILPKLIRLFALMTGPVGLVTAAIVALGAAAIYVVGNWEAFSDDWKLLWWGIKYYTVGIINDILRSVNTMIKAVNPMALLTGQGTIPLLDAPSPDGLNVGNNERAQSWAKVNKYKSFTDTLSGVGNSIWEAMGGANGQKMLDDAEKKLNEMSGSLGEIEDKVKKLEEIKKSNKGGGIIAGSISGGFGSLIGSIGRGAGQTGFGEPESRPSDFMVPEEMFGDEFSTQIDGQTQALENYKSVWLSVGDAISSSVGAMGEAFATGGDAFAAFGKAALNAAADIAKALLIEAFMTAVKDSTKKAGLPGLIIGAALGIAAIGTIQGMISNIGTPKLAQGGLAYGPTQAIVGDNPNAHIDPEVISPLSKLKNIMGGGGGSQTVQFKIGGRDMYATMLMNHQDNSRMMNPTITRF